MSVAEIITELHKLTPADLRMVRRELIVIGEKDQETACCNAATLDGARMLDRAEAMALLQNRLALNASKVGAWQAAVREARR